MRVVKNEYYDIYYDETDKKDVERAKRTREKLIERGFELSDSDAHTGNVVCDQMLRTKIIYEKP